MCTRRVASTLCVRWSLCVRAVWLVCCPWGGLCGPHSVAGLRAVIISDPSVLTVKISRLIHVAVTLVNQEEE